MKTQYTGFWKRSILIIGIITIMSTSTAGPVFAKTSILSNENKVEWNTPSSSQSGILSNESKPQFNTNKYNYLRITKSFSLLYNAYCIKSLYIPFFCYAGIIK